MSRVYFLRGGQRRWFEWLSEKTKISPEGWAEICGVSVRTFRDWRRGKFKLSGQALSLICKKVGVAVPANIRFLPDYWYVRKGARKGALERLKLYGPFATPEGRKKGGVVSQLRRRRHPSRYSNCINGYPLPRRSADLAELIGIILGDGAITKYQLRITLNKDEEKQYIGYVSKLLQRQFAKRPRRHFFGGRASKTCNLSLNGILLVKVLRRLGLEIGSKVLRQAPVPKWIKKKRVFSVACLRGLVDTDGGVYYHRHTSQGFKSFNLGLSFSSHCRPLIDFVRSTLLSLDFSARLSGDSVNLYRLGEVVKYQREIGFHNFHHARRLREFMRSKKTGRGTQVV